MTTDSELNHIARPSNAFILFRSHLSQCAAKDASSKAQDGNNNSTGKQKEDTLLEVRELKANAERVKGPTSKEAGMMWKDLDDAERALWKTRADHVKHIHSELHPNYKYKPRSKKDKEQLKVEAQAKKKEKREAKQLERNTRRAGQGAGRGVSTSNTKGRRSSPDVPYPVPPRAQITRLSSAPLSSPPSSPSYMSVSTPSSSSSSSSVPSSVEPSPAFSPRYPSYRGTANLHRTVALTSQLSSLSDISYMVREPVDAPILLKSWHPVSFPPTQDQSLIYNSDATIASNAQPARQPKVIPGGQQFYRAPVIDPVLANMNGATATVPVPTGNSLLAYGEQQPQAQPVHWDYPISVAAGSADSFDYLNYMFRNYIEQDDNLYDSVTDAGFDAWNHSMSRFL